MALNLATSTGPLKASGDKVNSKLNIKVVHVNRHSGTKLWICEVYKN